MLEEYPQIIRTITGTPWLIIPENFQALLDIVNMRINGEAFSDEEIRLRLDAARAADDHENPRIKVGGGVGVVSLSGPIFPKANLLTALSGATSLEEFTSDLRELMTNDSVRQVVIDFNSPGGTSDMVSETGSVIKELSAEKPIYGMANTTAGSAALWLLSQTTKAYSTPSGKVGSLGVYTAHEDRSGEDAKAGRKITIVSVPKFKAALNPHEALSEEGKQYMTDTINELYGEFVDAVANGRGKTSDYVKEHFGDGRMLSPKTATEVGMIDGVISMNDFLGKLVEGNSNTTFTRAKGDLSYAVEKMHKLRALEGGNLLTTETPVTHYHVNVVPKLEGGEMDEKLLAQLRQTLGLSADADETAIQTAVTALNAEVEPLRELKANAEKRKTFAQEYPEEYARLVSLEQSDREAFALKFQDDYKDARVTRTTAKDGESSKEPTTLGFSGLALTEIGEFARKMSNHDVSVEDFRGVIDSILSDGIVDYGTKGSSRIPEEDKEKGNQNTTVPGTKVEINDAFSKLLETVQSEEKFANVGFNAQLAEAQKRNPELAEAWRQPPRLAVAG